MNLLRQLKNLLAEQRTARSEAGSGLDAVRRRAELGMTLIEIMVVVAIIGLLMGTVSVVAWRRYQKARVTNAKQIIGNVQQALGHYRLESNEDCPSDISDLYTKKYLSKKPVDPWGQQLIFKCPGEHDTEGADISSMGPDKQEGTEDDIVSWETEGEEE